MIIGSGFYNATDSGKTYISIALDKAILEIYPNLKEVRFSLNEIPVEEQKENGPGFRLSCYKPEPKDKEKDKE